MQSDLNRLEIIFANMQRDGFDTTKPLRWGFCFFDDTPSALEALYDELKDHDYQLDELTPTGDDEWKLYVTKVDTLTPEKLHKRNIAFNDLALHCNVKLYDGWDVEKV